jgi:hypothetical protein
MTYYLPIYYLPIYYLPIYCVYEIRTDSKENCIPVSCNICDTYEDAFCTLVCKLVEDDVIHFPNFYDKFEEINKNGNNHMSRLWFATTIELFYEEINSKIN